MLQENSTLKRPWTKGPGSKRRSGQTVRNKEGIRVVPHLRKTRKLPLGNGQPPFQTAPSNSIQDGSHLFELQGGMSIKLILIILVMALIYSSGWENKKNGINWTAVNESQWTRTLMKLRWAPMAGPAAPFFSHQYTSPFPKHQWVDQQQSLDNQSPHGVTAAIWTPYNLATARFAPKPTLSASKTPSTESRESFEIIN